MGLASSHRLSPHMPRPWTPVAPPKSNQYNFFMLASVALKTSPTTFDTLTMLTWLQGNVTNLRDNILKILYNITHQIKI